MWIDPINSFSTGVSSWCDLSSIWDVMCLCLCCWPNWEWVCALVDKCCTENIARCLTTFNCTAEYQFYVWSKPSASYPPPLNLLSTAAALCSSILIIPLCLFLQKQFSICNLPIFFQTPLPPLSAERRSGVHLNPLLSEHGGEGVVRQSTDHNGWQIISSKGGWGVGRSERLWGEWINTPVNF